MKMYAINDVSTPQQIHARLFNHSDREWCTANHQLLNCNDTGLIRGHYMWVNDRSVLSNATKENQESKSIKKYSYNQNYRNNGTYATIKIVDTLE